MREKTFYHSILKESLLNGVSVKENIDRQTAACSEPEKKHIRISKRAVIAIAAAAVLLITGTAVAASSGFARSSYTPDQYLSEPAERREASGDSIPDVENALRAAKPTDVSYTIRMMTEADYEGALSEYREYREQPPFREADYAWVNGLKPTIGDVIFDGNMFYVTTYIKTDRPEVFEWNTDTAQDLWIACEGASYLTEGETERHSIALYGESWYKRVDDNTIMVQAKADLSHARDRLPEEGILTVTETLYVADGLVESDQPTKAPIAIIEFTFTFDAAAGHPVAETQHISIPLSGEHLISMQGWYRGNGEAAYDMRNETLSLDGVTLDAKIEYRPVGIYVTLTVENAPEDWTDYERVSLLAAIDDMTILGLPDIPYRVNGEEAKQPEWLTYGADGTVYVLLPVYPSDYDSVTSLSMDLILHRIVAANGSEPSDEWNWSSARDGDALDGMEIRSEPLTTFEIPIPKMK